MVKGIKGKAIDNILRCIIIMIIFSGTHQVFASKQKTEKNVLETKEFKSAERYISQTNVSLEQVLDKLANRSAWKTFRHNNPSGSVLLDPRSGRPVSLTPMIPLIPGTGSGNKVTFESLSATLGYKVVKIDEEVIKDSAINFLRYYADVLSLNMDEIGSIRATHPVDYLWHVFIRRQVNGIPVRDASILLSINHGNLVLWGMEKWGDINANLTPSVHQEEAIKLAFDFLGSRLATDKVLEEPFLELIPIAPQWDGVIGKGYAYLLAWNFVIQREGYINRWEFLVDAHKGKIVSMQDLNLYTVKKITGAVYPISSDGCCPDGCASYDTPMIKIDTGFYGSYEYTNYGGFFTYLSGTARTLLEGRYASVIDSCGTINESSPTGDIDLGGTNGQHDCSVPSGHSTGDTFASRTAAVELTAINRIARSWVNYSWLDAPLIAKVNKDLGCNAYWDGFAVNFLFPISGGCGNAGEIASIIDHEWGHGLDMNDANGAFSNPTEGFADIIAALRLHNSCIGRGLYKSYTGCGPWITCPSDPGTAYGYNCTGYADCCLACTGFRDIDYGNHASNTPHTPSNHSCLYCGSGGGGPCGGETHCEGVPIAEAAWDLAARDFQAEPFNYDKQTAFELTTRLVYTGSGAVTNWFECVCPDASSGCSATNGYMQWITADDDDGNLNNGTPHMTAIYSAFARHEIACPFLPVINSGCEGGPIDAPEVTAVEGCNNVQLSWEPVAGASRYYVYRSEGIMGCDFGKSKIADVANTFFIDTEVHNSRTYYYSVQPVSSNSACLGPLSNCLSAIPEQCISCAAYEPNSTVINSISGGDGDGYVDNLETATVAVTIENIGTGIAANTRVYIDSLDPFINIITPMPIDAGNIPPAGSVSVNFMFDVGKGANQAQCMQAGTFSISVETDGSTVTHADAFSLTFETDEVFGNKLWAFEPATSLEGWTLQSGTWGLTAIRVNSGGSTRSLHSSQYERGRCDVILSPDFKPTASSLLTVPNWYGIQPSSQSIWYDRAQVYVINEQTSNRILIAPIDGKLYKTGTFYYYGSVCKVADKNGWAGDGADEKLWGDSVFDLSPFAGQWIRLELRNFTDILSSSEGVYVDDIEVNDVFSPVCDVLGAPVLQPFENRKPAVDDTGSPLANGIIEPDEEVNLVGTLENTGMATAASVTGYLTSSDPIIIAAGNAGYPDILPQDHETCTQCYNVTAPSVNRTATHWDFTVNEEVSAIGTIPQSFNYNYHVGASFQDITPNSVFYPFIETLLHSGISSGCTTTKYCPSLTVPRGQMSKFLCESMRTKTSGSCTLAACTHLFADVPQTNIFCPYAEALYTIGIVSGCSANPLMYCPQNNTQRQAFAKFMCLGLNGASSGSCPTATCASIFNDVPAANPFCSFIEAVYNLGIVSGCSASPKLYCPANSITRDQISKFLVNGFGFVL